MSAFLSFLLAKKNKSLNTSLTAEETPESIIEQKGHIFFHRIVYTILCANTFSIIGTLNHEIYGATLVNILLFIINLGWLWLAYKGYYKVAKFACMVTLALALSALISLYPISVGLYIFYLPIAIASLALFARDSTKYKIFFCGLIVLLGIVFVAFQLDFGFKFPIDEAGIQFSYSFNFFTSLLFTLLSINFFIKTNDMAELALRDLAKKLETKNQLLEKTNNNLDRIIYSTTHDLRSPLASVKGLIGMAKEETNDSNLTEYFSLIDRQLFKLDSFISELLHRNTDEKLNLETIRVSDTIKEILNTLKYMEGFNKIQIVAEIDNSIKFKTDQRKFTTIISNLISNAVKYHDYSKDLRFIKIEVSYKDKVNDLQICITDNGLGISNEDKKNVFDMFYRASQQSYGSGLGLAIVLNAVEKLNGQITLESQLGHGSTFTVIIPNGEAKNAEKSEKENAASNL